MYLIDTRAEGHEIERIIADLDKTQARFQNDLEKRQQHIQTLTHIITTDQKFRSFLSQIKDNFYPFTAEIGKDTDADFVFMLDDEPAVRAVYAKDESKKLELDKYFTEFDIENYLDTARRDSAMVGLHNRLYSSHVIPLKESRNDSYAVGLIVVINEISDDWVKRLLNDDERFQAVFFNQRQLVAKNIPSEQAAAMLNQQGNILQKGMFSWNGQRYIAKQIPFDDSKPHTGYILSANLDRALAAFRNLQQQILLIGGGILLFGALWFILISTRITRPLQLITKGTQEIRHGNYRHRIDYQNKDEVGQLATAFNVMAGGLQEKEQIRNTFNKYVDPNIVSELLSQPESLKLGGERKEQTVLFSDIAGFTNFSEKMPAEALVAVLNEYLAAMTLEISQQQGILDKFIGDAIMAFWNPELCKQQHARHACLSALNMQQKLACLRPEWMAQGRPEISIRIGIATGEMIVGNIGSEQARSYTCIGDKVNYSSRLEGLNKYYGTEIMIDAKTASDIDGFVIRELDTVRVKGREEGERIFELLGLQADPIVQENIARYQQALSLYRQGDFNRSATLFAALKDDRPSQIMLQRCVELQKKSPENWDGIHSMLDK